MRQPTTLLVFWALLSMILASTAWAVEFDLPLDCPQEPCLIQNYYDHDPGPGWMDYSCGSLSYDGHNGTDFRVSYEDMEEGVPVYAAAPGRVVATRDGMDDVSMNQAPPGYIKGREAGNGVRIDHGDGWVTQYSHLKKGSILVKKGQVVDQGQQIGLIGLSGATTFPHVEFMVHYNNQAVGPFTGPEGKKGCGLGAHPLWSAAALEHLAYHGGGLLEHGFSDALPDLKVGFHWGDVKAEIGPEAPMLVYWLALYGVKKGDRLTVRITNPDGSLFGEKTDILERTQAQRIQYLGKKRSDGPWPSGLYVAHCILTRGAGGQAEVLADAVAQVRVP